MINVKKGFYVLLLENGHFEIVKFLVENGAHVNTKNK